MIADDAQEFFDSWDQCAKLYGKSVSRDAKEMAFALLVKYPLEQIQAALQTHMTDPDSGRFMPRPADVIGKIQILSSCGFIGAEEAWSKFPRDESQSACVCQEMLEAWGVACELDEISGRMAFKETYSRLVIEAKAKGREPKWIMSLGENKAMREHATLDAVAQGLLGSAQANVYLPHIPIGEIQSVADRKVSANKLIENHAQTVKGIGQLLLANETLTSKEDAKSHITSLKKLLEAS